MICALWKVEDVEINDGYGKDLKLTRRMRDAGKIKRKAEKREENWILIIKTKHSISIIPDYKHPKISHYQGCSLHPTHGAGGSALS